MKHEASTHGTHDVGGAHALPTPEGANGAAAEEATPVKSDSSKTATLSDGRVVKIRKAKGAHLEQAASVARDPSNPISLMTAVVAQVATIDGERVVYEELLELDMADLITLIGLVSGNALALSQRSVISS